MPVQIEDNNQADASDKKSKGRISQPARLGRGLAALLGDIKPDIQNQRLSRIVPIEYLKPNPNNPRKQYENINDLVSSIQRSGIIQPIIVRPGSHTKEFEIVAGERRWRAAQQACLSNVPIIIHLLDDQESLEIAIVENVQRTDLNPLEEAAGYQQLLSEFNYTQDALAKVIGKSRSHVANTIRLLKLPDSVQEHLITGILTAGHARTLINSNDPDRIAKIFIEKKMNVREAELFTRKDQNDTSRSMSTTQNKSKDTDLLNMEKMLGDSLDAQISISHNAKSGGVLRINYKTRKHLDFICSLLKIPSRYSQ